jgi:hypothetical protein
VTSKEQCKSMYVLLWNQGTQYFCAKDYGACREFYQAALYYADAGGKATVARQLALAHMALKDLEG